MIGGVNYGGGHRTQLREQLMCYGVPPALVYKGGEEEEAGQEARAMGGVLLGVGSPLFLSSPEGKGRRGRGRGKGARPLLLVLLRLPRRGARARWEQRGGAGPRGGRPGAATTAAG